MENNNKESLILAFNVDFFLDWHGVHYTDNANMINAYKEFNKNIISKEYFDIIKLLVSKWENDESRIKYYVKIIRAIDLNQNAAKHAFNQAKRHFYDLIDTNIIKLLGKETPLLSDYIANELDEKESDYIKKLEQSDAIVFTKIAAQLANIKIYQWLCEWENEHEKEILTPSVSATVETSDEKADGKRIETSLQMQLFEEINQFGFDKFMSLSPLVIDNVLSKLFNKSERSVRDVRNSKKSNSSNKMITHKGILGEMIEKPPKR